MVIHPMVIMGIQTYSGYKNPRLISIGGYENRIPQYLGISQSNPGFAMVSLGIKH